MYFCVIKCLESSNIHKHFHLSYKYMRNWKTKAQLNENAMKKKNEKKAKKKRKKVRASNRIKLQKRRIEWNVPIGGKNTLSTSK